MHPHKEDTKKRESIRDAIAKFVERRGGKEPLHNRYYRLRLFLWKRVSL
jgi:hypothetical protein